MPIATERNNGPLGVTSGDKKNSANLLSAMGVRVSFLAIPAIEMFPLAAQIFVERETPPIFFSAFSSSFSGTVLAPQRVIASVSFGRAALQKHVRFGVAESLLHSQT